MYAKNYIFKKERNMSLSSMEIKNRWNGNLYCDISKNCFRKYLHLFKTMCEFILMYNSLMIWKYFKYLIFNLISP